MLTKLSQNRIIRYTQDRSARTDYVVPELWGPVPPSRGGFDDDSNLGLLSPLSGRFSAHARDEDGGGSGCCVIS